MAEDFAEVLFPDIPLIDGHVHVRSPDLVGAIAEGMDSGGCLRLAFVSITRPEGTQNEMLRRYKKANADRFYTFGALDYGAEVWLNPNQAGVKALAARLGEQPARLKAEGFDGIKMIESKPTSRRRLPWPLDSEVYAQFFANAEKTGLPLIWHVGDPPQFWDPHQIHAAARARGWLYDRPGDASLEQMRSEAENVLRRHLGLRVIFAHFFFLSHELDRARAMFKRHPNVCFDTTPGAQMFINFIPKREEAREFFLEFQDRIIFGTDLNDGSFAAGRDCGGGRQHRLARAYYGTDGVMPSNFPGADRVPEGQEIQGLELPKDALRSVFAENFERIVGKKPASLPTSDKPA